jgi:hypothetical protein
MQRKRKLRAFVLFALFAVKTRFQESRYSFTVWEKGEREGATPSQITHHIVKEPGTLPKKEASV